MLHEENNGLNLKQYTPYSSNQRSKKKTQPPGATTNRKINNNNNNSEFSNNNLDGLDKGLAPVGRVRFNVGVMLLEAAARNDFEEVKRLLTLGVSPDSVNHDGLTALHQCCIDASEPIMNLLLEFGANVDARDTEQWTPLHAACTCGHLNLVKILVENGADLLAVNGDGNMPFDICEDESTLDYIESQMVKRGVTQEMIDLKRASTEMQMLNDLEKMVDQGEDLNLANESGVTQLHVAAANGYLSAVKFLLKHGVNVNVCDNDLWRPLHGAACWGNEQHIKIVELLVEAGAQLNAKTNNDETVFDLCDNAELLEKLNQLKDELESKQASGSDKLKRTQSRTNSRVHSVRRTSVRDKNQISRREAREEALLRVDSSPIATAKLADSNLINGTNGKSHPTNENGEETSERLSSESSSSSIERSVSHQTNLLQTEEADGCVPKTHTNPDERDSSNQLVSSSATSLDNASASDKCTTSKQPKHDTLDSSITLVNNQPTSNAQSKTNHQTIALTRSLTVDESRQKVEQKSAPKDEHDCETGVARTNEDTACDYNNQKLQYSQQVAQQMVQLAPINYTLSNLKKQRSDLRMRAISIGNGITNSNGIPNGGSHQVILDPQPASLADNGLNRPESPSLTFRKFRGEPSELIGGNERDSRHKCCILI